MILITGISGFVAGHLARTLAGGGETVVGIGRRPPAGDTHAAVARYFPCDVTDAAETARVIASAAPHTVYHLAAHAAIAGVSVADMLHANVGGTLNVLEACRAASVPACVVASSDKQYGSLAKPPYYDDDRAVFENGGAYELSKSQADQTARLFAGMYEVPAVRVARLVNLHGAGDTNFSRIIPGTIRRCLRGEPARVTSGAAGEALREYVHVADAVTALRLLARDATGQGNALCRASYGKLASVGINVCGGGRERARWVIHAVRTALRDDFGITSPEPEILPNPAGVYEEGSQYGSGETMNALSERWAGEMGLRYAPRSLAEGLRGTIPWYLDYLLGIG